MIEDRQRDSFLDLGCGARGCCVCGGFLLEPRLDFRLDFEPDFRVTDESGDGGVVDV